VNLLAGAIATYQAATLPAVPTGFWDRQPKPTPGRLRRLLSRTPRRTPGLPFARATSETTVKAQVYTTGAFVVAFLRQFQSTGDVNCPSTVRRTRSSPWMKSHRRA